MAQTSSTTQTHRRSPPRSSRLSAMWASSKQCLASAGVPRSGFGPKPRCGFLTTTSLPASRRHLLDYVVVSVVEEVGCMDRNEFQRGFGNVFGDDLEQADRKRSKSLRPSLPKHNNETG